MLDYPLYNILLKAIKPCKIHWHKYSTTFLSSYSPKNNSTKFFSPLNIRILQYHIQKMNAPPLVNVVHLLAKIVRYPCPQGAAGRTLESTNNIRSWLEGWSHIKGGS